MHLYNIVTVSDELISLHIIAKEINQYVAPLPAFVLVMNWPRAAESTSVKIVDLTFASDFKLLDATTQTCLLFWTRLLMSQ